MSDQFTTLFRERFAGHEMDVPPGAWEHVSGQLAASASGESLRDALQDKFLGHEVEVAPSAWANISGQLAQGAGTGSTLSTGWIAAGVAAVALTAGVLLWPGETVEKQSVQPKAPIAATVTEPAKIAKPVVEEVIPAPTPAPEAKVEEAPVDQAEVPANSAVQSSTPVVPPTAPQPKASTAMPSLKESVAANETAETTKTEPQPKATVPAETREPAAASMKSETQQESTPSTTPAATAQPEEPKATNTGSPESGNTAPDPFRTEERERIFIPNTFTPNGDEKNDSFGITLQDYTKADMRIFSAKSANLVFQTNDLSRKWDGRLPNGNFAEEGYYLCVVNWTDHEGRPHSENMTVRLFR